MLDVASREIQLLQIVVIEAPAESCNMCFNILVERVVFEDVLERLSDRAKLFGLKCYVRPHLSMFSYDRCLLQGVAGWDKNA